MRKPVVHGPVIAILFGLAVLFSAACATSANSDSANSCVGAAPRIAVIGDNLGQRAPNATHDRALYLYCNANSRPTATITKGLLPYISGVGADSRGNIYIGETSGAHIVSWAIFAPDGGVSHVDAPSGTSSWAIDSARDAIVALRVSSCSDVRKQCGQLFTISGPSHATNNLLFSFEPTNASDVLIQGPIVDDFGHFFVQYGRTVFAFNRQNGKILKRFFVGTGPWTVGKNSSFYATDVNSGAPFTICQYGRDLATTRCFDLKQTPSTSETTMVVAHDGTAYVRLGSQVQIITAARSAKSKRMQLECAPVRAAIDVDDRGDLYALCPYNSAFSGNSVQSVPAVFEYSAGTSRLLRTYRLPPLAPTFSASGMAVFSPTNADRKR